LCNLIIKITKLLKFTLLMVAEDLMRETFHLYGSIQEVRVFPDKGFAFVRYVSQCLFIISLPSAVGHA